MVSRTVQQKMRRLLKAGLSVSAVARRTHKDRKTVRRSVGKEAAKPKRGKHNEIMKRLVVVKNIVENSVGRKVPWPQQYGGDTENRLKVCTPPESCETVSVMVSRCMRKKVSTRTIRNDVRQLRRLSVFHHGRDTCEA